VSSGKITVQELSGRFLIARFMGGQIIFVDWILLVAVAHGIPVFFLRGPRDEELPFLDCTEVDFVAEGWGCRPSCRQEQWRIPRLHR
jgi:hypothetical protein